MTAPFPFVPVRNGCPNDGRTHRCTAQTPDAAGNYSPRGETVTITMPRF